MKKLLLVLGALMMVFSGVAMVSAYEAHTINVTATVENALSVDYSRIHYGTVFPEEWLKKEFSVGTSGSFCSPEQTDRMNIDYEIWCEWKPKTFDPITGEPTSWYPWLGDALWLALEPVVDINGDGEINLADDFSPRTVWTNIGDPPATKPGARKVLGPLTLTKPGPGIGDTDFWRLALDVPVFEGYYNPWTDVPIKPSGLDAPTVIIDEQDDPDRWYPEGILLGVDLKIQVIDMY